MRALSGALRGLGMADYWKATERYHCSICDVFLPNVPYNIINHEKSKKHLKNKESAIEEAVEERRRQEREAQAAAATAKESQVQPPENEADKRAAFPSSSYGYDRPNYVDLNTHNPYGPLAALKLNQRDSLFAARPLRKVEREKNDLSEFIAAKVASLREAQSGNSISEKAEERNDQVLPNEDAQPDVGGDAGRGEQEKAVGSPIGREGDVVETLLIPSPPKDEPEPRPLSKILRLTSPLSAPLPTNLSATSQECLSVSVPSANASNADALSQQKHPVEPIEQGKPSTSATEDKTSQPQPEAEASEAKVRETEAPEVSLKWETLETPSGHFGQRPGSINVDPTQTSAAHLHGSDEATFRDMLDRGARDQRAGRARFAEAAVLAGEDLVLVPRPGVRSELAAATASTTAGPALFKKRRILRRAG